MIGSSSREDIDAYGYWAWFFGLIGAFGLVFVMFAFATPIS